MKEAVYRRVHGRSNLNDPDERMRLAGWCRLHGLHTAAIDELQAALRLDPDRLEAKRLLRVLPAGASPRDRGRPRGDRPQRNWT